MSRAETGRSCTRASGCTFRPRGRGRGPAGYSSRRNSLNQPATRSAWTGSASANAARARRSSRAAPVLSPRRSIRRARVLVEFGDPEGVVIERIEEPHRRDERHVDGEHGHPTIARTGLPRRAASAWRTRRGRDGRAPRPIHDSGGSLDRVRLTPEMIPIPSRIRAVMPIHIEGTPAVDMAQSTPMRRMAKPAR